MDEKPLARTEFRKPRGSLWEAVLAPAFISPDEKPARSKPVDGVLMSDLHVANPTRLTCNRDASKLETIYRALSSTCSMENYNCSRIGQLEGAIFKDYVNGDDDLL